MFHKQGIEKVILHMARSGLLLNLCSGRLGDANQSMHARKWTLAIHHPHSVSFPFYITQSSCWFGWQLYYEDTVTLIWNHEACSSLDFVSSQDHDLVLRDASLRVVTPELMVAISAIHLGGVILELEAISASSCSFVALYSSWRWPSSLSFLVHSHSQSMSFSLVGALTMRKQRNPLGSSLFTTGYPRPMAFVFGVTSHKRCICRMETIKIAQLSNNRISSPSHYLTGLSHARTESNFMPLIQCYAILC
ncbi:hypothetical protein VNO77_03631 [Canavalia gladiata]|uniref:Uncharacterized protein n=1 Tax=Canavalia gladiata TaxID=3824 RepID=A0AAN9MVV8_CANGL